MIWIVDYRVGNTYKVKEVEAETPQEAYRKANRKHVIDVNPKHNKEEK